MSVITTARPGRLDTLREKHADLVAAREQVQARVDAHNGAAEHDARLALLRNNPDVRPSKVVRGPVQALLKGRADVEAELRDLDADIAAVSALIVEIENENVARVAEARKKERDRRRAVAAAVLEDSVVPTFVAFFDAWRKYRAALEDSIALKNKQADFPGFHSVLPVGQLPGDFQSLFSLLGYATVGRGGLADPNVVDPLLRKLVEGLDREFADERLEAPGDLHVLRRLEANW
jgi:hypothetical protein